MLGVGALIERNGALLLERRVDAPLWSLIAGRVENDESLTDGLRREVLEETGLVVARCELFGTFTDPTRIVAYPDGAVMRVASFVYRVAVESFDGLRASEESEEFRFITSNRKSTPRWLSGRTASGPFSPTPICCLPPKTAPSPYQCGVWLFQKSQALLGFP